MPHTCHAAMCKVHVPPEMFMCKKHWYSLPKQMRDKIWRTYRPGQCDDWQITSQYAEAARGAVRYLAVKDDVPPTELDRSLRVYDMLDPKRYEEE